MSKPLKEINADRLEERIQRMKAFCDLAPDNLRNALGPYYAYNILRTFFSSRTSAVFWIIREGISDWYSSTSVAFWLFWHARIMRRSPEEIDARFDDWIS